MGSKDRHQTTEPGRAPDLSSRLALRPAEAARCLGLSERALRTLAPELPRVRRGRTVLYPVSALRRWLDQEARTDGDRINGAVEHALSRLQGSDD